MTDDLPPGFGPDDPTASPQAYTDETGATFTLKEHLGGTPWIMIEEDEPGLPVLKSGDAFIGLRFRPEVSFAEAQRFTTEMRNLIDRISYTKFIT